MATLSAYFAVVNIESEMIQQLSLPLSLDRDLVLLDSIAKMDAEWQASHDFCLIHPRQWIMLSV